MKTRDVAFRTGAGFSIMELLVTVAIITMLGMASTVVLESMTRTSSLNATSQILVDQLNLARQTAVSRSRPVEVRFYELPDAGNPANKSYQAVQIFLVEDTASIPLDKPAKFSNGIQVAASPVFSNLLDSSRSDVAGGSGASAGYSLPEVGQDYIYKCIRFRPDGSAAVSGHVFVTLHNITDPPRAGAPPRNWFTVSVNSSTGRLQSFRP